MKAKTITLALCLLAGFASCSNNEDNNNEQEKTTQGLQFSFTEEDFGADEEQTRTTVNHKPEIVDLGDCEAEVTVENEPAQPQAHTRTIAGPTHYTIRAYQGGALKGQISGTFNGTVFTPDASSSDRMLLPHGTYDFVAYNDDVTASGNDLTVTRDKVGTARIGTTTENINQDPKQYVSFSMKHVGARLRTQFVCQKDLPAISATLEPTATNIIPVSVTYNPMTKTYTGTNGAWTAETSNSPASVETKYNESDYGKNYSYTSTSNYHYFLPATEGSKLKLSFITGKVFWKATQSGTLSQLNGTLMMQANKSYLVKIKLKPNYLYLMSDGTTGHFKDTTFGGGSKTPIAVVVDEAKRTAMALYTVNVGSNYQWTSPAYYTTQVNKDMKTTLADLLTLENGYDETWDASASMDNITVKGNSADFPAFKACDNYTPYVSMSGTMVGKKWYLPAYGEWKYVFSNLGFGDISTITKWDTYQWYGRLASGAFTQVSGSGFIGGSYYWSSSEYNSSNACFVYPTERYMNWGYYGSRKDYVARVRPFIHY
ncbi:hypothetical protein [Hoylesella enoeca]|uniref:Fibrobacter succinogenes major paralogous domain-containing protein n=1 Tax=Hoylesella enoeca TaxID=76123 RepID=A0A0S2KKF9_9BACT|nr:hypothetical protein [Hoylesella enoeca]ALO48768.1 hypothetical protein AS203_06490 [Hoylesella enoeca]